MPHAYQSAAWLQALSALEEARGVRQAREEALASLQEQLEQAQREAQVRAVQALPICLIS